MSGTVATPPVIAGPARLPAGTVRQYLAARSRLGDGTVRVLLLRADPSWDAPAVQQTVGGLRVRVAVAPSVLAVHEQILGHLDAATPPDPKVLVVLTDREDTDLDPGLLARVYGGRIRSVDNWEVVQEAFDARGLDGRLRGETWAAEALLDAAATRGWPSLGKGVLSRDEALTRLARRRLRLGRLDTDPLGGSAAHDDGDRIDPVALFRWTLTPGGPDLLRDLRGPERTGLARFLAEPEHGGPTGKIITALVDAEHGADAAAYAVVCAALWGHAEADHDLYRVRGRAERWLGEQPPAQGDKLDRLLASFGHSGEAHVRGLVDRGEHRLADPVLNRANQLVAQFGAQAAAAASPLLPAGLDARFTAAGRALDDRGTETVTAAVSVLAGHALAADGATSARIERVRMAARLRQWLAGRPEADIASVADGTARQIRELGWVDRALEHLEAGGDSDDVLANAYSRIGALARDKRRELDRAFSERLAVWTTDGTAPGTMLTVESFLHRVVAPVVACPGRRVLLLLIDGMSAAIASDLGEELRGQWAEFDPLPDTTGAPVRRAVSAALPTLTAVSRTSLFAGTLMKGDQSDEKRLFPQHPCWNGAPAAVFHKDDLRGPDTGSPFSAALTEALADERTHVAVVLNTLDDRLAKEQKLGDGAWQTKEIAGLDPLLRAARANGMTVLLTSDHGHVIERRGSRIDAAGAIGSARHRSPGGPVTPAEIELSGPRVVWPEPGSRIVALRDHDTRYTALKAGYHGGATLAEFTIPLLALLPFGAQPPAGWRELGDPTPSWWTDDAESGAALEAGTKNEADAGHVPDTSVASPRRKQTRKAAPPAPEGAISLFGEDEVAPPAPQEPADSAAQPETPLSSHQSDDPAVTLVERLMATELYQAQLDLLARKPRDKTVLPKALAALVEAGTLPMTALAERAGQPATRAPGFAATLAQLLNYDGAQILEILPDNRTLRLHRAQMIEQFGL
jgi:hypothetical protein